MESIRKLLALFAVTAMVFTGCSGTAESSGTSQENTASSAALETTETYPLTVDFLKVGKADAAVISTENHVIVIDCGETTDGKKIRNCLNYLGRDTVDYMILTHYDQDHIGGAAKVINEFTVNRVFAADYDEPSDEFSALTEAMSAKSLSFDLITSVYTFSVDDVYFEIYPCQQKSYHDGNDNNHSLVVKMIHHDEVFLFTGDAMQERLVEIMDIGDCDVLKEPYHGREVANLGDFLDKVSPEYAIVTTDEENYADATAQALADRNIETYVTFRDGNIRCTSTGSSVSFETGLNFKEDTGSENTEVSAEETN